MSQHVDMEEGTKGRRGMQMGVVKNLSNETVVKDKKEYLQYN